ncbi:MAG: ribosome biogenesis GTP-binding protein YihA/YsxC [Verrucomicrobiota bacterium]
MKITSARFITSAVGLDDCPQSEMPEFAFIGRSNVGKSSLLNLLCNQKLLAKVSSKPGRTRLINFFVINEDCCFVDLPGYGYAKAAKSERQRFNDFVADYIEFREGLKHVFMLIDSRHEPMTIDIDHVTWLVERKVAFSLVFTKSDKVKPGRMKTNQKLFLEALSEYTDGEPLMFTTSAKSEDGRLDMLQFIDGLARS